MLLRNLEINVVNHLRLKCNMIRGTLSTVSYALTRPRASHRFLPLDPYLRVGTLGFLTHRGLLGSYRFDCDPYF